MLLEKSAGAVIFRKEGNKTYYLLLHYPRGARKPKPYWDFPKGHIEKGEKELDTVKREVREETGLEDIGFVGNFKERIEYFFRQEEKNILKLVTFYLAETKEKDVKISSEHAGFKWLSYEKALKKLTFQNAQKILQKAKDFIPAENI